jgi:DNA-binding response OmpR family regulator
MLPFESPVHADRCLVLAHTDLAFAALASRHLHRAGWNVYLAKSGAEARHLTNTVSPAVVVLDTDLGDESGWLICEKLSREQPSLKVILVSDCLTPELSSFASFVGAAALILRQDGMRTLLEEVSDAALPAAS